MTVPIFGIAWPDNQTVKKTFVPIDSSDNYPITKRGGKMLIDLLGELELYMTESEKGINEIPNGGDPSEAAAREEYSLVLMNSKFTIRCIREYLKRIIGMKTKDVPI